MNLIIGTLLFSACFGAILAEPPVQSEYGLPNQDSYQPLTPPAAPSHEYGQPQCPAPEVRTVEKIVYQDRPVEKIVYQDRPVDRVVYQDRPVDRVVYQDRVVYKDR